MTTEYITSREVAEELGIQTKSVSLYHRNHGIGIKKDGRLYFKKSELDIMRELGRKN